MKGNKTIQKKNEKLKLQKGRIFCLREKFFFEKKIFKIRISNIRIRYYSFLFCICRSLREIKDCKFVGNFKIARKRNRKQ